MQLCVFLLMQRRSQLMALSATSRHTTPVPQFLSPCTQILLVLRVIILVLHVTLYTRTKCHQVGEEEGA